MSKSLKIALIGMVVILVGISAVSCFSGKNNSPNLKADDVTFVQLQKPTDGQEIAIIDTTLGTFKVALYREYAPKTVEHFVNLANSGYYNDKYYFSVEKNVYFLTGTTNKSGTIVNKGEPNYDTEMTKLDNEIHKNLWPIKGSLIALGPNLEGSGTFICGINTIEMNDAAKKQLNELKDANKDVVNTFIENGGIPTFAQKYTVFAQTYEGMDVFEKLCNVDVEGKQKTPKDDIKIKSITISKYNSAESK